MTSVTGDDGHTGDTESMISIADEVAKHVFAGWEPADPGPREPACACGWRGPCEPGAVELARDDSGGRYFSGHRLQVDLELATHAFSAGVAATALTQAAEAWIGDEEVARWLQARADHVKAVGPL